MARPHLTFACGDYDRTRALAEDLRGKVVGTPEYQLTACVWMRGILADRHGVPFDSVSYLTGGQETAGRIEKAGVDLPDSLRIGRIPAGRTLSAMLAEGEIDALYTPRAPSPFVAGDPRVRRVFPDVVAAEKEYHAATGIFPIMHVVVIRRDVYDRHPWVAQSLYSARTSGPTGWTATTRRWPPSSGTTTSRACPSGSGHPRSCSPPSRRGRRSSDRGAARRDASKTSGPGSNGRPVNPNN